jgi:hypothetical protein
MGLHDDHLYELKHTEDLVNDTQNWHVYSNNDVLFVVLEVHINCNESVQIFRYFCIMHFQLILYVSI